MILLFFLGAARPAAASNFSVSLKTGYSNYRVKAGTSYADPDDASVGRQTGTGFDFRPQINIEMQSYNLMFDVFYQGRLGSNIGSFPLNRFGGGIYYFPLGMPLYSTLKENGVKLTHNQVAPFVGFQLMLTAVSITDTSGGVDSAVSFNGLALNSQINAGVEFPFSATMSIILELQLESTLSGGTTGTGLAAPAAISVSGTCIAAGVTLHP